MKRVNLVFLSVLVILLTGFSVSPSAPAPSTQTAALTVLVCPQFVGGYDYTGQNIISTALLVKVSGLNATTTYKFTGGMISSADIADLTVNCYGYGRFYFPEHDVGGIYKISPGYNNPATATYHLPSSTDITTDAAGEVTFWVIVSPNNNDYLSLQQVFLCIVHNRGDGTDIADLSGRLISDVSFGPAANFTGYSTVYDYAQIEGHSLAPSGKYVFIYDQENPTAADRPLHGYMVENNTIDESSGYGPAPAFYSSNVNTQAGRYGLLYPIANINGIRCIKIFNADGSTYSIVNDADGIWPSGLNTTNMTKGSLYTISEADAPLPVELVNFRAQLNQNGKKINLFWETKTEVNSYMFEIQRQVVTEDWLTIGKVPGHGNSNSPKEYSFSDGETRSGNINYRLKMIDNDGSYEFSPTVSITTLQPTTLQVDQNYPNPFNPITTISYSLPQNSFVTLRVYDILGKEVAILVNGEKSAGNYTIDFDGNNLTSGTYLYRLNAGGQIATKKMILMK